MCLHLLEKIWKTWSKIICKLFPKTIQHQKTAKYLILTISEETSQTKEPWVEKCLTLFRSVIMAAIIWPKSKNQWAISWRAPHLATSHHLWDNRTLNHLHLKRATHSLIVLCQTTLPNREMIFSNKRHHVWCQANWTWSSVRVRWVDRARASATPPCFYLPTDTNNSSPNLWTIPTKTF